MCNERGNTYVGWTPFDNILLIKYKDKKTTNMLALVVAIWESH